MAHGLAMAGGAVRATDDMAYPAGLPGSLRLEPRELHQLRPSPIEPRHQKASTG